MKFPAPMDSWCYRNPESIADGLIARTARQEQEAIRKAAKPEIKRRDVYHTQSRRIEIRAAVQYRKKNGGSNAI